MNKFEKAALLIIEAYDCYKTNYEGKPWETTGLVAIIWATPEGLNGRHEPWGFIQSTPEGLNVVFRGTESIEDWINNAELSAGWDKLYNQFRGQLLPFLNANSHLPITLYGHSAGCCLAKRVIRDLPFEVKGVLIAAPLDVIKVPCEVANNVHDIVPKSPLLNPKYFQTGTITNVSFYHLDPVECHSIINYSVEFHKQNI